MSEEEKNAINIVKNITADDLLNYWEGAEEPYNAIQTVLELIEKLQQENQKLKSKYDKALTDLVNEDNKIIYLNKVIDKMATAIDNYDKEEDTCAKYGKQKDCYEFENNENCIIDCIKEYFFKEVEND